MLPCMQGEIRFRKPRLRLHPNLIPIGISPHPPQNRDAGRSICPPTARNQPRSRQNALATHPSKASPRRICPGSIFIQPPFRGIFLGCASIQALLRTVSRPSEPLPPLSAPQNHPPTSPNHSPLAIPPAPRSFGIPLSRCPLTPNPPPHRRTPRAASPS